MTDELKAAVERAWGELSYELTHPEIVSSFIHALADEPDVIDTLWDAGQQEYYDSNIRRSDILNILQRLAEIVK